MTRANDQRIESQGFAPVNGLSIYYEVEGTGDPLIYIPPAFGVAGVNRLPGLIRTRSVITVDVQGHGRTRDRPDSPITLRQNADDIVGILRHLGIEKVDLFGESYGGATAVLIAMQHPKMVRRVATYGATFGPPQIALNPDIFATDAQLTHESVSFKLQRENYKSVASDPEYWPMLWGKVCGIHWHGFSQTELESLEAPLLIALGDHDFVRLEHAVETFKLCPNAELAVIPDAGHFCMYSEPSRVIEVIDHFLQKPEHSVQIATAATGYQPGVSR